MPNFPASQFNKYSPTSISLTGSRVTASKKISLYSAFISAEMETLNACTPGGGKQKLNNAVSKIADKWKKISQNKKEIGTWHNADISANYNMTMSIAHIKEELSRLNRRTGDEPVLLICRGTMTHFHAPESFCSSERTVNFVSTVVKLNANHLAYRMDAYMCSGIEGVARSQAQILLELKHQQKCSVLRATQHRSQRTSGCLESLESLVSLMSSETPPKT
ncbi:hypothetical protein EV360DRAFT_90380 [Lentinula raphanica]|nr:hypothetical protein EV360DRAFT_90380 [Lentinula raphanica]